MPVFLQAIAAQFYRGIGPETQYITGFSKMNFFVGPNNAGKSVVLNLIHDRLPFGKNKKLAGIDQNSAETYRGTESGQFSCAVGSPISEFESIIGNEIDGKYFQHSNPKEDFSLIFQKLSLDGNIWRTYSTPNQRAEYFQTPNIEEATGWLGKYTWQELTNVVRVNQGGGTLHQISAIFQGIAHFATPTFPQCLMIPAKRKLGPKDETFDDQSGKGLINHLAAMQNPGFNEDAKRNTFNQINDFVRAVTSKPDAQLNIPDSKDHLLIHMDGKTLPLDSLGTGIHEVILIAAFCTIHQNKIMCIEEPEIHLHPILQRKLIRYLQEETENQYFIATHSAAFIDTPGASVYRVRNDGVQTFITPALQRGEQRQICDDLGYKASDIMQANVVIWVEGPSDRIYLKHWIKAVDATLIEGVDYSIMFYGGALIKHLSADDDAIKDFINLQQLNRNFVVILDSDKEDVEANLKPAAQRIQEELAKGPSFAWITKGREIENYVPADKLQAALKQIHSSIYKEPDAIGPYDHAFYFKRKKPAKNGETLHKDGDKVGAARAICQDEADLTVLDLEQRIKDLVAFIQNANKAD